MAKTPFTGFGQPAHLYAQYAAVVDQMCNLFTTDVDGFFDAVRDRVRSLIPAVPMHEHLDKKNAFRWWWLADDYRSRKHHVYIWMRKRDPEVVEPGVLRVRANAWPVFRKPHKHLFAALGARIATALPPSCAVYNEKGSFFTVSIRYGASADPVGEAAPPVAEILKAIYNEEGRLASQRP